MHRSPSTRGRRIFRDSPSRWLANASVLALTAGLVVTQAGLAAQPGLAADRATMPTAAQAAVIDARHAKDQSPPSPYAKQFAQARKTGQNVPVDELSTEFSETVATPQGHLQLTSHPDQQRMKSGGRWKSLDATLKQQPGGGFAPAQTPSGVVLSSGGSGPLATLTSPDGKKLAISAPFALPAPQVDGAALLYPSVLPDTDLKVTVGKSGSVSTVLVVKTAAAAANPALKTLHFGTGTGTDGVTVKADADHNLIAAAADGPRWTAPAPTMWDSGAAPVRPVPRAAGSQAGPDAAATVAGAGKSQGRALSSTEGPGDGAKVAAMPVTAAKDGFDLVPDQGLLTNGQFPKFIDPGWIPWQTGSNGNTFVQSSDPNGTHYNVNGPADIDHLGVGYCDNSYANGGGCSPSSLYRSFYQFDTSALSGAIINSARVDLSEYLSADWDCTANYGVDIFWENGPIGSGTNWGNQPQPIGGRLDSTQVGGSGHGNCYGNTPVAYWNMGSGFSSGISGNNMVTIGLRANNENDPMAFKRFDYGATLSVTYDRVPNPPNDPALHPVPTKVNGGDNQGCGAGWGQWSWIGAGSDAPGAVTLAATVSSPAAQDQLQTRTLMWDYNNNDAGLPGDGMSPWAANGQKATYTIPSGYIHDGHVYAYHQQTTDLLSGSSWSGFGPQCIFAVDETPPQVSLPGWVADLAHEFPPSGNGQNTQLFAGQAGYIVATAVDPAPANGLANSGIGCLRWGFDPQLSGAQWQCGGALPGTESANNYKLAVTPGHWGTNIVYVQAMDNAKNLSPVAQYPFYAPWNPNGPPPVFGDVTGDGAPDMVTAGSDGNLHAYNVPGNATATSPSTSVLSYAADSPDGKSWANVHQLTHRGSTRGGNSADDVIAHGDSSPNLYVYPNGTTADGIIGHLAPRVSLTKPACQTTTITTAATCAGYYGGSTGGNLGDWSKVVQIAALGDISTTNLNTARKFQNASSLVTEEVGADGTLGLWFYPSAGSNTFAAPIKLGGTGWNGLHLMSPGDWAKQGHPGLWAIDAGGHLSGYTLTLGQDSSFFPTTPPAPTGNYPVVTAISAPVAIGWVDPAKYNVAAMQSDGDLSGRGNGGSALWDTDKNNPGSSNLTTWFGTPYLDGNGNPTGYNWDIQQYGAGNISAPGSQWPLGVKDRLTGSVTVDGSDTVGVNPMTVAGSGVTFGNDHPPATPELGSAAFGGSGVLTSLPQGGGTPTTLTAGNVIASGHQISSQNTTLTMQTDGNLVLTAKNSGWTIWATGTSGHPGATATMQSDGNFVVHDSNGTTSLWSTNTAGNTGAVISLQNDRNLVVYSGTTPLWNSHTYQLAQPGIATNGSWSASAWVKLNGTTGTDQTVLCQQGNSVPSMNLLYRDSAHSWGVYTPTQDSSTNTNWTFTGSAGGSGYSGAWTHIAATYSADSKVLAFYLNGSQVSSTYQPTPWVADRETTIGGCYFNNDHSKIVNQLNGEVSDVRSYPYQLTSQQVSGLYNVPKQALVDTAVNKCLDDNQANTADGNVIQIFDCNSSQAQQVSVTGDGSLHLVGKCVDGSTGTQGTLLKLWDCNGTGPQKFTLLADGTLHYEPNGTDSGLCVDDPNANTTNGTRLQLNGCANAQKWTLR